MAVVSMSGKIAKSWQVAVALIAATVFWFFLFSPTVKGVNFWTAMPVFAGVLAVWGIYCGGLPIHRSQLRLSAIAIGAVSALMLYMTFYIGNFTAKLMFDFAPGQVGAVYDMKGTNSPVLIALMLLFVSSPAEEIFWRGFLQKWMMHRWGQIAGWLMASLCYAAVHIVSGNFILVMAAWIAGLFWGLMYLLLKGNLTPLIISHSLWTFGIFIAFPIR